MSEEKYECCLMGEIIMKMINELNEIKKELSELKQKKEREKNDTIKPSYAKSCNTSYCGC